MEAGAGSQRRTTRSMSKHFSTRAHTVPAETKSAHRGKRRQTQQQQQQRSTSVSTRRIPPLTATSFGLIQERVAGDLYALLIAAMLWNRTKGTQARPVFEELMARYPRPDDLAQAEPADLVDMFGSIGLQNQRAHRFVAFARIWVATPPHKSRRYRRLHYPCRGEGADVGKDEVLGDSDPREGWEVAHLPGMGPYALDSYRIFYRDKLRGLAEDWKGCGAKSGFEPEWKRVIPTDKELIPYVKWMWLKEGWMWDSATGKKVAASTARVQFEKERRRSASADYGDDLDFA